MGRPYEKVWEHFGSTGDKRDRCKGQRQEITVNDVVASASNLGID